MTEKGRSRAIQTHDPVLPVLFIDTYPCDLIGLTGVPHEVRLPILSFAMRDKSPLPQYMYAVPMPEVAALAYHLQDVPRKVSGEPYFKHILRTVIHACDERVTAGMTPEDIRVLTGAAYLHDAIELKRQQRETYAEDELMADLLRAKVEPHEAGRIVSLVSALTPPHEGKVFVNDNDYVRYKVGHFREKFNLEHPDARLLKIIKTADMLANMEETADDIRRGLDDSRMGRSYGIRTWIFRACTLVIVKDDKDNPLLPELQREMDRLTQLSFRRVTASDQGWPALQQQELMAA